MELTKGANVALETEPDTLESAVVGLAWDSGSLECDLVAIVCDADRKALGNSYFIFWNQTVTPERSLFLRSVGDPVPESPDRAQVLLDLSALPPLAGRVVLALATVVDGATLGSLRSLRLRVVNPRNGAELASYAMGQEINRESCLVIAELYRHQDRWKVRAVGQGYEAGLAGLGRDYGVEIA